MSETIADWRRESVLVRENKIYFFYFSMQKSLDLQCSGRDI